LLSRRAPTPQDRERWPWHTTSPTPVRVRRWWLRRCRTERIYGRLELRSVLPMHQTRLALWHGRTTRVWPLAVTRSRIWWWAAA